MPRHARKLSRTMSDSPISRRSLVKVASIDELSKFTKEEIFREDSEEDEEEEIPLFSQSFEELPGAFSDGIDLDEFQVNPLDILMEKSRCYFSAAYVFGLLSFILSLFFVASLVNGGLPRYGVEEAERLYLWYNETVRVFILL